MFVLAAQCRAAVKTVVMKRLIYYSFFFAALATLAAGCSVLEVRENCKAPVTIHVSDFSLSVEDFPETKATAVGEYAGVKSIILAFYDGENAETFKATQLRDDPTTYTAFGEFSCSLPYGSYTMVVIGYGYTPDDVITLTSPVLAEFSKGRVMETFAATQSVTVSNSDALDLTATLNRIVAKLKIISTDKRAAGADSVRVTFSGGSKAFNPTTGLAVSNTGFKNTVGIGTAVGERTGSLSYLFLNADEQSMNVTVETLNAAGTVLFHETVSNVPFQRNRQTKMSGAMYSASSSAGSFLLNDTWLTDTSVSF